MNQKVRFRDDMVAVTIAEAIVLFTGAEFLAALQAEQRRRHRWQVFGPHHGLT